YGLIPFMTTETIQSVVALAEEVPESRIPPSGTCWPLLGALIFTSALFGNAAYVVSIHEISIHKENKSIVTIVIPT
ncbi:MAG: hypothetical protein M3044_19630, partial [Thermoproteota archaeon]|nr:hypothetical protein [Thermoproteota archaeon]